MKRSRGERFAKAANEKEREEEAKGKARLADARAAVDQGEEEKENLVQVVAKAVKGREQNLTLKEKRWNPPKREPKIRRLTLIRERPKLLLEGKQEREGRRSKRKISPCGCQSCHRSRKGRNLPHVVAKVEGKRAEFEVKKKSV